MSRRTRRERRKLDRREEQSAESSSLRVVPQATPEAMLSALSEFRTGEVEEAGVTVAQILDAQTADTPTLDGALERAAAAAKTLSSQPRFNERKSDFLFGSVYRWVRSLDIDSEPPYGNDSQQRDTWLRGFLQREPFLAGVIHTVSIIDQNRRWTLTGGRNQVLRYTDTLHDWNDGQGWRVGISAASQSYHMGDMSAVVECGRQGRGGPLRALYNVDHARCRLVSSVKYPLEYTPVTGATQAWGRDDFFRVVNMPSTDESLNGLGWCSVSRCLEMSKLLVAVWQHDHEQLGSRMPRGLLLLANIDQGQWDTAMQMRDEKLDAMERKYYGGVAVLASMGEPPDAKLVALSQLPKDFDTRDFVEMCMIAYAMQTGYQVREFMPWESGTWGTAGETDSQSLAATTKGGASFVLGLQEQLRRELPPSLAFEFESRDDSADLLEAQVKQAKVAWVVQAFQAALPDGTPLLGGTSEEAQARAQSLLAEEKVIPPEWSAIIEDSQQNDTDPTERLLSNPCVRRACEEFPRDEIVRYSWPENKVKVLFRSGEEALRRHSFPVAKAALVSRAESYLTPKVTPDRVAQAIALWNKAVPDAAGALEATVQGEGA